MKRILLFHQIPFNDIDTDSLLTYIISSCLKKEKRKVFNMNTQGSVFYTRNNKYRNAMKSADIIYPDGWGPVVASWFFPSKLRERVNVGDFIDTLLSKMNTHKLSLFLLGCEKNTVSLTAKHIKRTYPHIRIAGFHSGFFKPKDEERIISLINTSKPNLVLVGMGLPRQELFISRNWNKLPHAVYMGIGGVFYYITKQKSRAPLWMRRWGFEWFYRFIQEPKRLWRRYTINNIQFIQMFLLFFIQYLSKMIRGAIQKYRS